MKTAFYFLLFFSLQAVAQSTIVRNDGRRIEAESSHVEAGNKKLTYKLKDDSKTYKIKFKDFTEARWGDFIFRNLTIGKKLDGYYVMGEEQGKKLLCRKRIRVKSRGGFESTYVHYEVLVTDAGNNLLEEVVFTDENSDKKAQERAKVIPMVQRHFGGCKALTEKFALFESAPTDAQNEKILVLLNEPTYTSCQ